MAQTELLPDPVDTSTGDEDEVHAFCEQRELTWCGQDSRNFDQRTPDQVKLDQMCRVCLLAIEFWESSGRGACPICRTRHCLGS